MLGTNWRLTLTVFYASLEFEQSKASIHTTPRHERSSLGCIKDKHEHEHEHEPSGARAFIHAHKKTTGFEAVVLMRGVLRCL